MQSAMFQYVYEILRSIHEVKTYIYVSLHYMSYSRFNVTHPIYVPGYKWHNVPLFVKHETTV